MFFACVYREVTAVISLVLSGIKLIWGVDTVRADGSSDSTFQSTDGICFHLHTKDSKISTNGFRLPPDYTYTSSALEVVPLTEAASTLELPILLS